MILTKIIFRQNVEWRSASCYNVYAYAVVRPRQSEKLRISQERFGLESPNWTRTSKPSNAIAIPAIYGRHLSKSVKTVENAISDGFGSNFSGAAFCLSQPIGGLPVWQNAELHSVLS